MSDNIHTAYELAREQYAAIGVDTEAAVAGALAAPLSIHCWQGDDVGGFETQETGLTGGIMATGAYPGKARSPEELRADLELALSLIPGALKVSLHASYLESGGKKVDRDEIEPAHFAKWASWAKSRGIGLDFNSTFFSHPKSADGWTLSHADPAVRRFWIAHALRCREISAYLGRETGQTCVHNLWIPDGCKERPVDSFGPRRRLLDALNEIFAKPYDAALMKDAVESKLFGLGSESYVTGSHEFYLAYAVKNPGVLLTLDTGHFHPTEQVSAKLTALFGFVDELLLHVSRPVRWDSDHVVSFDDELQAIMQELVRNSLLSRTYLSLDYFDGSVNRVAAWVVGSRNTKKALLKAMLEPVGALKELEAAGDATSRLALTEEYKSFPWGAVWDELCVRQGMPPRADWLAQVQKYEEKIAPARA